MSTEIHMSFFSDDDYFSGPPLTDNLVQSAQAALGFRLPRAYLDLLAEKNGGIPFRRCFRMATKTSWASDHIEIAGLRGIGGEWGIDSTEGLGSADMIKEWGYPKIGIVICAMPSAGHDAVMLDYTACGPEGEPTVVYINDDLNVYPLADTFSCFVDGLVACNSVKVTE